MRRRQHYSSNLSVLGVILQLSCILFIFEIRIIMPFLCLISLSQELITSFKYRKLFTTLQVNITNVKHIITITLGKDFLFLYGLPGGTMFAFLIKSLLQILRSFIIMFSNFIFQRSTFIKASYNWSQLQLLLLLNKTALRNNDSQFRRVSKTLVQLLTQGRYHLYTLLDKLTFNRNLMCSQGILHSTAFQKFGNKQAVDLNNTKSWIITKGLIKLTYLWQDYK